MTWTECCIDFFLDGKHMQHAELSEIDALARPSNPYSASRSLPLLMKLNLAIPPRNAWWPRGADRSDDRQAVWPLEMEVDYVRYWARAHQLLPPVSPSRPPFPPRPILPVPLAPPPPPWLPPLPLLKYSTPPPMNSTLPPAPPSSWSPASMAPPPPPLSISEGLGGYLTRVRAAVDEVGIAPWLGVGAATIAISVSYATARWLRRSARLSTSRSCTLQIEEDARCSTSMMRQYAHSTLECSPPSRARAPCTESSVRVATPKRKKTPRKVGEEEEEALLGNPRTEAGSTVRLSPHTNTGAKASTPKAATPKATTPKATTPKATTPKASTPKASTPKASTPKASTPKAPTPKASTPKATTPKASTPKRLP